MTAQPEYDLDLKLAELKINGYVTFEDLIPVETIDRIREAFLPLSGRGEDSQQYARRRCQGTCTHR